MLASAAALVVVAAVVAALVLRPSIPPAPLAGGALSVLALPCQVFGAPEDAFLTDAVPQTMSTLLAQVGGLDTKVPPTSLEVEKVKGDLTRLADLYQVSSFIVTSITTAPGRYALNVQLVDATTRKVRWGQQYEGPRDTYNELVRQGAEGVRVAIRPAAPLVPAATVSSEAELAFREGTYFLSRYLAHLQRSDFEAALAAYTRTLTLDPTYAAAAAGTARLYLMKFHDEGDVRKARQEAASWARRAIGIDPRTGVAWAVLSQVELTATHADPASGVEYAAKGVAFAPREAFAHGALGNWVGAPGSNSLFVAAHLRAFDLNPLEVVFAANGAMGLCQLGKPQDALTVIDRSLRVQPNWGWGLTARAYALLKLGRMEEAERSLRSAEQQLTQNHTWGALWRQIRFALAVAQRDILTSETLARQVLAEAFDPQADANLVSNAAMFAVAPLARMGKADDAVRILLRSVEVGVVPGYDEWLLGDPDIQRLRGDPRFGKVLAASRDGAALVAKILGQARTRGELPDYLHKPLDQAAQLLKENQERR